MVTIKAYEESDQYITMFAHGKLPLAILNGPPGVGKTEMVIRTLDKLKVRYHHIRGYMTKTQFVKELYEHRDEHIIIDDVDNLTSEKSIYGVMREAFDTGDKRTVSYRSPSPYVGDIPRTFEITSPMMLITNGLGSNPALNAFKTRAVCIDFQPTATAITSKLRSIATASTLVPDDGEVLEYFERLAPISKQPNFRAYILSAQLKKEGIDWKKHLSEAMVVKPDYAAAIRATEEGKTFKDRAARFMTLTGKTERSYSRMMRELKEAL